MDKLLFQKLYSEGLLGEQTFATINEKKDNKQFSVHWELSSILYLGVLLLTTGLGILVYKNIDSIGHQAVLFFIALVSASGFLYCFRNKQPFSRAKILSPSVAFDYILILACLCFILFIGYLQVQYQVFGERYGLASFIPMVLLFFVAYFFDHLGILGLAIANLCAWAGITVTPLGILKDNDFNNGPIILTGLILGAGLVSAGVLTHRKQLKRHFAFTYTHFGMHLLFISTIAGMFRFQDYYFAWFLLLAGIAFYFYKQAMAGYSFYELLVLTLYFYLGMSYVVLHALFNSMNADTGSVSLACLYFIGSGIGLVLFLISMNKKLKRV